MCFTACAEDRAPRRCSLAWICDANVPPAADGAVEAAHRPSPAGGLAITRKALQLMRQHGLSPGDLDSSCWIASRPLTSSA